MHRVQSPARAGAVAAALVALAGLYACGDIQAPQDSGPPIAMPFVAAFTDYPSVDAVVITVSGTRINPPLVFNFPVVNDTARGTVTLPVGSNHLLVAQAFDSAGVEVLRGQRTISVASGSNAAIAVVMLPLTGTLPVTAVIGSVTLTLDASAPTVRAGGTLTMTAEVRDETNQVVAIPVRFAVSRPPAARLRDDGLLLALDTGTVTVTATALGRAASTTISITPGSVLEGLLLTPDSLTGGGNTEAVISIRDDVGIDSVRVALVSPSAVAGPSCTATAPLRGSRTLGDFSCTLTLSAGAEVGRWPVASLTLHAGVNTAVLDSIALRNRGAAAAVRIVP